MFPIHIDACGGHTTSFMVIVSMKKIDPLEPNEHYLATKVVFLEKRVSELEKDTAANGEQHSRLRQENLQLVHR